MSIEPDDPLKGDPPTTLPARSVSTMRVVVLSTFLIVVMLAVSAGIGWLLIVASVKPPRRQTASQPPLVTTAVIYAKTVLERFDGYGTVRPIRKAKLAAEVAATVVERVGEIREGSAVLAAQALIRLDDRQYGLAAERADALAAAEQASLDELLVEEEQVGGLLRTAERELDVTAAEKGRVSKLFERQLAARKEYDFSNLAYQQARRVVQGYQREAARIGPRRARLAASKRAYEADVAQAQLNIERCTIRAPFAGRIESLLVDVGSHVAPGSIVLSLVDSSRVEVSIQLPSSVYARVAPGSPCTISTQSQTELRWVGEVGRVAPSVDEQTRTFSAYVVVDNKHQPSPLIPGMFVRARVEGPSHPDALLVPRQACRNGRVFVVNNGVAHARSVVTRRFIDDHALVEGELQDGDRVILSHLDRLTDGMPVRFDASPVAATSDEDPVLRTAASREASP